MKLVIITLFCSMLFLQSNAQDKMPDPIRPKQWIGVNHLSFAQKNSGNRNLSIFQNSNVNIIFSKQLGYSFGIDYRIFKENNKFHHFDVLAYDFSKEEYLREIKNVDSLGVTQIVQEGSINKTTAFSLGWRTGKLKPINEKLSWDLSYGVYPYYAESKNDPTTEMSSLFPSSMLNIQLDFRLYAGVNFNITKKLVLYYHINAAMIALRYENNKLRNPNLTLKSQEINEVIFDIRFLKNFINTKNIGINYVF